jgi:Flp pilus assembly pilin Flp
MKAIFKKFVRNESGAALVEYGVALLVVIMVGTVALITIAQNTTTLFERGQTATGGAVTATD